MSILSEEKCPRPPWLRALEHTADTGMEVTAFSPEQLFARCAWGMFYELVDMRTVRPMVCRMVEVTASDQETLLVRWLSELNYLHAVEHIVANRFEIQTCTPTSLKAQVWGEPIDPTRHLILNEIKAVTYYLLKVEHRPSEWYARVLFDV